MPWTLRPADASDADALADLFLVSRRRMLPFLPEVHSDQETLDWFTEVVLARCDVCIAHGEGPEVLGLAAVDVSEGVLEHLYLHPDCRRRGIGTQLLGWARSRCPDGLHLWCFAANHDARAFYEHHGFRILERGDGSTNEEGLPDLLYGWSPEG